jgi:ABC-type transport system involved in cytochrome bd biosynthesis fused ATPase/permease subunit
LKRTRLTACHHVLIVDEPATGLDASTAADVVAAIRDQLPYAVLVLAMHEAPPWLVAAGAVTVSLNGGVTPGCAEGG